MRIEILESAQEDLIAAHAFYEGQGERLGTYFLDTLFSDIDSLHVFAGIHAFHFGQFHRLLSKRFPFAVYYTKDGQTVRVHAVLDCRRDPKTIEKRLDG